MENPKMSVLPGLYSVIERFWEVGYPKHTTKAPQNSKSNSCNAKYTLSRASILEISQIYDIVMLYFNVSHIL